MLFGLLIFISAILALCLWIVGRYWEEFLALKCLSPQSSVWAWAAKGIAVPMLLWLVFNFALAPGHVAVIPRFALANATPDQWSRVALELLFPALPVVASCWTSMTLSWLVFLLVMRTEGRHEISGAALFWVVLLSPAVVLVLYFFRWPGLGTAALMLLVPVLRDLLAFGLPRRLPPAYERALERLHRGETSAAEIETIRQLENHEDDYKGWMLLAGIYATRFGDLREAERTVREVIRQPGITRAEFCAALMQLGDWHLEVGGDVAAARGIWSEIHEKFPHTEFADAARRKLNRLANRSRDPKLS